MTPFDTECLESFASWLEGLPAEVAALSELVERPTAPEPLRRASAESLAFLLRSFRLIPDGVESLGYLENLFAFRAIALGVANVATEAGGDEMSMPAEGTAAEKTVARLAREAELVARFLGDDFGRLHEAVALADERTRPGERAHDLLGNDESRAALLGQIRAWASDYRAPELPTTEGELLKLRAFMRARLHS